MPLKLSASLCYLGGPGAANDPDYFPKQLSQHSPALVALSVNNVHVDLIVASSRSLCGPVEDHNRPRVGAFC